MINKEVRDAVDQNILHIHDLDLCLQDYDLLSNLLGKLLKQGFIQDMDI